MSTNPYAPSPSSQPPTPHHEKGPGVGRTPQLATGAPFTADYRGAEVRASPNFWAGNQGRLYIVVHSTAAGGQEEVPNFSNPATQASTTYAVSRTGHVVQYVREADTHWGNCCAVGTSLYDHAANHNWTTIAIECEKCSDTNEEPLLPAQYQALLTLVKDVGQRNGIPMQYGTPSTKGILFHHDLDPVSRARCPGNFPYTRFIADLQQSGPVIPAVRLSSRGEVASYADVSQMEPNESEEECGFFAVAEQVYAGPPETNTPTGSPEDVDVWADSHGGINTQGVSTDDMHNLLKAAGLPFVDMPIGVGTIQWQDIARVMGASGRGFGVIATALETSIQDEGLNGANPYAPNWTPSGNHVISATGLSHDSNLLFHDTAAINGGIFGKIATQPRVYLTRSIEMHWATIVQFPWCQPIPNGDPLTWPIDFMAQGGVTVGIPQGWTQKTDKSLVAPNNIPVVGGFAQYILTHPWDANNYPLAPEFGRDPVEESNPANGPGTWQNFRVGALAYTVKRGVYVAWVGQELQWFMAKVATFGGQLTDLTKQVADLTAHVLQLEAIINGGPIPGGVPQNVKDDLTAVATAFQTLLSDAGVSIPPPLASRLTSTTSGPATTKESSDEQPHQ